VSRKRRKGQGMESQPLLEARKRVTRKRMRA
jgi:hypothetical protein